MLTCSDIEELINQREKEKIQVELKSFRKTQESDKKEREQQKRELAYEIIALANRYGGKLVFGINDNGTFDGKLEGDIDALKRDINNICYDNISPTIECNTQFLECSRGDVFIIYIPKRKSIPHAYVPNKKGNEINSRIYYIRTSHGKRLVNDAQLEWIFKHPDDPNFSHQFRIAVEFDKQLKITGSHIPFGNYVLHNFLGRLTKQDKDGILKDSQKFYTFLIELFPYFILSSLSDYYSHSWYIGINKNFDRVSSGPMITNTPCPTLKIVIDEIPVLGSTVINTLSWNFKNVLKKIFSDKFHIPPNTDLRIEYEKEGKLAKVLLKNPNFLFTIRVGMLSAGAGLHNKSPYFEVLSERHPLQAQDYSMSNFFHFDGAGYLEANFEFPEYEIDTFNKHLHYFNTLKELIDDLWNFNKIIEKLPRKELLVMDDKLNEILELLNQSNVK